jgi:hypothetical protein
VIFSSFDRVFLIALVFWWGFLSSDVLAVSAPQLVEPNNNSQTSDTTPKLAWSYSDSCFSRGSCFQVIVDDAADFSSPEKSPYTNNFNYSPSLGLGKWYWRVKAKDSGGNWSEFSETRTFQIVEATSMASPPVVQSSNNPSGSDSTTSPSFLISQVPGSVLSENSFGVKIDISNLSANSTYYLKGAFFKSGSTNYFGKTLVSGNWVKNAETAISQYKMVTDGNGSYSGNLDIMVDDEDSGFIGSGEYFLKVGRYNSSGNGLVWSNSVSLQISGSQKSSGSSSSKSLGSSAKSSPVGSGLSINVSKAVLGSSGSLKSASVSASSSAVYQLPEIGQVAGEAFAADDLNTQVAYSKIINWWFVLAGVFIVGATASLVVKLRKTL